MKRLKLDRWIAPLALSIVLTPALASAQEADTLSIWGAFHGIDGITFINGIPYGTPYPGMPGADLAQVSADGGEHYWTLTLHGVSYSHDYSYTEWSDEWSDGYLEQYITRVHATSFDFQFFGPDADILNAVVSSPLTGGGLTDEACIELSSGYYFDSAYLWESGPYAHFDLGLQPVDPQAGVSFYLTTGRRYWPPFSTDENGYPVVEAGPTFAYYTTITDLRPGNFGGLASYNDLVVIGSSVPPPSTLSIADGSVREGNKGTSRLDLQVTLSWATVDTVTVNYSTSNGTALAKSDYTATAGTLTFQSGQTSRTISVAIKTDRKREPNETFIVQLSNAVGTTISDGVATATILNDD